MAKRFIDTDLFDDSWFMDLSKDGKLLWLYLITKCDHAGIIEINTKLIEFQTGIKTYLTVSKELANRLIHLRDSYYFIPKFISFQYPNFPNSRVRQQESAIKILSKFDIDIEKINSYLTLSKDLPKSYVNDSVSDSVSVSVNASDSVSVKSKIETKKVFGEFVKLSHDQFNKLLKHYGEEKLNNMLQMLDVYIGQSGDKQNYKSHYHVLLPNGWVNKKYEEQHPENQTIERIKELKNDNNQRNGTERLHSGSPALLPTGWSEGTK